jgi:hypothetical protein
MAEYPRANDSFPLDARSTHTNSAAVRETSARENDAALLALDKRFEALTAELDRNQSELGREALANHVEVTLARLDPIERAIMETPAGTIVGLGVKARHTAYVLSQYWEAPIDRIDWDARAVRLLIEAICDVAHIPLLLRSLKNDD